MVRAFFPQFFVGNIEVNTNYSPEGRIEGGGVIPPAFIAMLFETGETMLYEDNSNSMIYESSIPSNWFDTTFTRRILITIQASKVPTTQTDFPLLFNSTVADFILNAKAAGEDFRFVLPNKTELKYERQFYDNTTGELITHTKIPSIDGTTDTLVYLYYGKPTAADGQDVPNVWDSNYKLVLHMSQVAGGAGSILDSTSNNNNANPISSPSQVTGQIGNCLSFNGTTQKLDIPNDNSLDITANITLQAWAASVDTAGGIVEKYDDLVSGYRLVISGTTYVFRLQTSVGAFTEMAAAKPADANFHHVVGTQDSLNRMNLYVDGALASGPVSFFTSIGTNTKDATVAESTNLGFLDGQLDEIRISDIDRSAEWITTEFNNQSSPSTFYTLGPVEIIPIPSNWFDTNFKHRIPITINTSQVSTTQTDFPLLFNSTVADFILNAKAAGEDFRFVLPDKTELAHEIQFYDNAIGQNVSWARVPSIQDGTVVYLYYNNPVAVDNQDPHTLWSNYRFVHHMEDSLIDSTASNFDGTSVINGGIPSAPVFKSGQIHRAFEFGAITLGNFVRLLTFDNIVNPGGATDKVVTEFWFKGTTPQSMHRFQPSGFMVFPWTDASKTNIASWDSGTSDGIPQGNIILDGIVWNHVVCIWERNVAVNGFRTIVNGALQTGFRTSLDVPVNAGANSFYDIGSSNGFELAVGDAAEHRFGDIVKPDDFYIAEFNNQNNPSAFYTLGSVEILPIPNNWFDTNFKRRIPITINASQVPSTQTDFPFLFNSTVTDFIANARTDGFDFRFVLPNKTELKYERQFYDNTTGELITHTKIPSISDGTVVYLYYNDPTAADGEDTPNVWTNGYHAVYHMSQIPAGVGSILDSTSNNFNGNPFSMVQTNGKIGKALDYNGNAFVTTASSLPSLPIVFEMWVNSPIPAPRGIWDSAPSQPNPLRNFDFGEVEWWDSDPQVLMGLTASQFQHLVFVYRYDGNRHIDFYRDGVFIQTVNGGTSSTIVWSNFTFGNINLAPTLAYDGILEEFRITTGMIRTADWITTQYNNQNNPSAFYTMGAIETIT